MSIRIKINKNEITIGNKHLVLSNEIKKNIVLEEFVIILIEYSKLNNRNIYCYDFIGNLVWQIVEPIVLHTDNYYTDIYIHHDDLYAYSISGIEYKLNKSTGEIIGSELIK
jgi:hypothetical protein